MPISRWWRKPQHEPLEPPRWRALCERLPLLRRYGARDAQRLGRLMREFEAAKDFSGAGALRVTPEMRQSIAVQACVPILGLGLDWYAGWRSIIVYPAEFYTRHEYVDEAGVVHREERLQSGEAWQRGPVILSWPEVAGGGVVIHEFAHKLDMLNGEANGMPPLHREMDQRAWTRTLSSAYEDFCVRADSGVATPFDDYAAEAPGEFFAVASEVFFVDPAILMRAYPGVYAQLRAFYRQDPLALDQRARPP